MLRRLMITRGQEQIIEATSLSIKAVKLCADTVAVIVHVCAPQPVAYLHGLELVSCEAHDVWLPIRVVACTKIVSARSRLTSRRFGPGVPPVVGPWSWWWYLVVNMYVNTC